MPKDWAWATLRDISYPVREHVVPAEHPECEFNYLSIENIESETGRLVGFSQTRGKNIRSAKFVFTSKDVLYSKLRPYLNKVHLPRFDGISATDLIPIRPCDGISREYLAHFLRSRDVVEYANERTRGIQLPRLPVEDLLSVRVPVPPSAEQARIVARIDELLEELQLARQALWKVPALMNKFHQSILSKAFRGELVEKTSSVTSRSNLSNVPGGEAYHRVASNGQELPEGWVWVTLGKIADVRGGVTKGRKFNGKQTVKMPYLRVANVQSGYLDLSLVKEIEVLPGEVAEYSLHFGDVLFTEGGDRDKLGRGTVWRDEVPNCLHQNHVFRARISSVGVSPEYVSLFSQSTSAREYFFSVASQTVNLASINITSLRALPIPLAPFDEQERIVIVLGDAARRVKFVGEIVQGNLHRCTELEQSILAKAFKGELVSQDLDDEPASILLHRLRTISTNAAPKRREEARKVTS